MLTLNGLRIGFIHNREENSTTCFMDGEQGLSIAARAKCSDSDKFSREIGRRISLARLLKEVGISRKERVSVWEDYRMWPTKSGGYPK